MRISPRIRVEKGLSALPFHRKFIQSVNNFSGMSFHMQWQLRNFSELFVYTVTVPFSRWIIFIYRSSDYRRPPALPSAPLSSGCTASKIPGQKTALLGAERTKSPEKTALLGAERTKSLEETALLGAERTKSLEKMHFWVQSEQNPWGSSFVLLGSELACWWGLLYRWNFGGSSLFMQLQLANFQLLIL